MNPIQYFLDWLCKVINPIIAIFIGTLLLKTLCIPIYTIRFENYFIKDRIKYFTKSINQRSERKKCRKQMYNYLDIKKWTYLLMLYFIEFTLILFFLKAIHGFENKTILWFQINEVDGTYYLPLLYLLTLIIIEILNLNDLNYKSKSERNAQLLVSAGIITLLYVSSKSVISGIVIYWCISSVYSLVIKKILLQKRIKRRLEKEYANVYLDKIYKMLNKEGYYE